MSDNPMLSKMDALLKKHRGDDSVPPLLSDAVAEPAASSPRPTAPPHAWLPVLTQVIERGTPPVATAPVAAPPPPTPAAPQANTTASATNAALTEQVMGELAPRLSEVMEKQVTAELRKNLDETVATLLSQLDVSVREIVRDAVAEKLKQPRDPSA